MFNSRSMHCPLRTARFTLRPVGPADGPVLLALLAGSPAVELDGAPLHNLHQADRAANLLAADPATARAWVVVWEAEPIGLVSIHNVVDATGELAFFIATTHRRQRCALEAVTAVIDSTRAIWRLQRLVAHTESHNLPARQLLSQLGFFAEEGAGSTCRFTHLLAPPRSQGSDGVAPFPRTDQGIEHVETQGRDHRQDHQGRAGEGGEGAQATGGRRHLGHGGAAPRPHG